MNSLEDALRALKRRKDADGNILLDLQQCAVVRTQTFQAAQNVSELFGAIAVNPKTHGR